MDLADEFNKFMKIATPETTVNDFFDYVGIPRIQRTDFAFNAIMKQAAEKERMRKAREEGDKKLEELENESTKSNN